jgi:ribonuclease T2
MHRSSFRTLTIGIALILIATVTAQARSRHSHKKKKPSSFAYYMLVLSYAPDFCAESGSHDPNECGDGRHVGFVVHGMWPQAETTRGPENCGPAGQISASTIQTMLSYIPTESLIKHEWAAHGTCSGLKADDYFALVRKARDAVKIPDELLPSSEISMSQDDIQTKVAEANPSYPETAFRESCYPDKKLEEVRICLDKGLTPRACGSSAGHCSTQQITLLPVH